MLNLDSAILVNALKGSPLPREEALLRGGPWAVSPVVFREIFKLNLDSPAFRAAKPMIQALPLDYKAAAALAGLAIRSDPADEIVAATSIAYQIPLLTRARRLPASKVVPPEQ
jgi:predicted nucleic acid-binding protein